MFDSARHSHSRALLALRPRARGPRVLWVPSKARCPRQGPCRRLPVPPALPPGDPVLRVAAVASGWARPPHRLLLRLLEPTAGRIVFDGEVLTDLSRAELQKRRARTQIVFQDPFASLNSRRSVGAILGEPLLIHRQAPLQSRQQRVADHFALVGLPAEAATRYPHEFSGGQRQPIAIARALALSPDFIVCDEAVSSLDVSVQAQIIALLKDLQRDLGLTYLFISHNLAVVRHISNRLAVMDAGRIVEIGETDAVFARPRHPYTRLLIASLPVEHPSLRRPRGVQADEATEDAVGARGCAFAARCPHADRICRAKRPPLRHVAEGWSVACHHAETTG